MDDFRIETSLVRSELELGTKTLYKTGWQRGEEGEHLIAPQTALLDDTAVRLNAVNLENMLSQIEADRRYLHGGCSCPDDLRQPPP
jgi:hypothetical protein